MVPNLKNNANLYLEKLYINVIIVTSETKFLKRSRHTLALLTLQQTQNALSGLRLSQPVFPASLKRFMNSV